MATLSDAQIAGYAGKAGFSGENLKIAVAVAKAESGGNPTAHNAKPPDDSYGLWQINMLGSLGPDRRKRFNLKANTDLYDPATNARAAYGIFTGSGWGAWSTYKSGAYKKYYDGVGLGGIPGTIKDFESGVVDGVNPLSGVPDAITAASNGFGDTVFKAASNFAGVIVALVLLILGVIIVNRDALTKIIPAGKVAKLAKTVGSK